MPELSEGVCQVSFLCLVTAVRLRQCGIPVKWDRAVGQGMQMDAGDVRQPKRNDWNDWAHEMDPPNLSYSSRQINETGTDTYIEMNIVVAGLHAPQY